MLAASLYSTVTDDRRASYRAVLGREGTVRAGDNHEHIVVNDLTRDGCRITTDTPYAPGDVVGIGIGGVGVTYARIAWAGARDYGCAFLEPLLPGRVTAAFEATNLVRLPAGHPCVVHAAPMPARWPHAAMIALVLGSGASCWAALAIGASLLA